MSDKIATDHQRELPQERTNSNKTALGLLARCALVLIRIYQRWFSPWLGRHCRFEPSCSRYTALCIERFGLIRGGFLGAKRIVKCQPFHAGGHDPAPLCSLWVLLMATTASALLMPQGARAFEGQTTAGASSTLAIETKDFRASFEKLGGGLVSFRLKGERFQENGAGIELVSTDRPEYLPLRGALEIDGTTPAQTTPWKAQQLSAQSVRLSRRFFLDDVKSADGDSARRSLMVTRKVETGQGPYQLWVTTQIVNEGTQPTKVRPYFENHHYVSREDEEGGGLFGLPGARSPTLSQGLCAFNDEVERNDRKDLLEGFTHQGAVDFSGVENVYFLQALATEKASAGQACRLKSSDRGGVKDKPHGSLFSARLDLEEVTLAPGEKHVWRVLAFIGPKTPEALSNAGHGLPAAVDFGFFAGLARGLAKLLRLIHSGVGNWGFAIILLTLLVKAVLFPLTAKSFQSMAKMRKLKPEIDAMNAKYADAREKKAAATMELYRKHKINPLGGCLPQLLQLPIWWALYTSLSTNIELYHTPFVFWWQDLSAPDPFFVLPIALGLLMVAQQKLMPTTMDPAQAKVMMYMMPIMITSFMLFLPSGLCLYMFTNSAVTIGQQKIIERMVASKSDGDPEPSPSGGKGSSDGNLSDKNQSQHPTGSDAKPSSRGLQRRMKRGRA